MYFISLKISLLMVPRSNVTRRELFQKTHYIVKNENDIIIYCRFESLVCSPYSRIRFSLFRYLLIFRHVLHGFKFLFLQHGSKLFRQKDSEKIIPGRIMFFNFVVSFLSSDTKLILNLFS